MVEYENYEELVVVSPKIAKIVEDQYKHLSNSYAGHIKDMIKKVEDMKNEMLLMEERQCLRDEKNKIIVLQKDNEINMLKKDLEIERLKYENLTNKLTIDQNNKKNKR
jgi:hypothetical protein